jgi:membrane-anchored mycosin MYCP
VPIIGAVFWMRRGLAVTAAVAFLLPVVPGVAEAAPSQCAKTGGITAEEPWPRAMLAPDTVWPFTLGGGTTVAVLSTGVDRTTLQLRGRVLPGYDAVADRAGADSDCTGTGTQVAGVIVAQPTADNGVVGLAPKTTILPVRVVPDLNSGDDAALPAPLARGVAWASSHGADVIVVAAPVFKDDQAVQLAVADAVKRRVVVVAAVGDLGSPQDGDPTPFPAAYPDVVGVGAIGANGQVWEKSQHGTYVDLVAPGAAVPTVQRGRGLVVADGTAIAAGFVGGAAALVVSKRGDLVGPGIAKALLATASPAPSGSFYGAGVVNPYGAVTQNAAVASARPLPVVAGVPFRTDDSARRRERIALAAAALAALAVVAALLFTAAARRGRRQKWAPRLAPPAAGSEEPAEPGPPVMLLDEPSDSR